jgi:Zn-dependent protease/CBS domain-containing protein
MLWSFPIGRLAGTTVRVHIAFLLLLAWIWLDSYMSIGLGAASRTLVFVIFVFGCVVAHEFGHVFAARLFGVATPDITLYPFGGIARLNTMPQEPWREFLISAAGPAVNLVIVIALMLFADATLNFYDVSLLTGESDGFLATKLATANMILALFNLIPAFPMDGGRLLRAALATRFDFERATRIATRAGHIIALGLAVVGLFSNPMLIVIAIFISFAGSAEMQATTVRAFSSEMPVTSAMVTEYSTLQVDSTVSDAVGVILRTSQKFIPVLDRAGRFAGGIEIADILRALQEDVSEQKPVADYMRIDIPTLRREAMLDEAFRMLQEKMVSAIAVVGVDSRLNGLVTLETLGEMLMLHDASARVFDRLLSAKDQLKTRAAR